MAKKPKNKKLILKRYVTIGLLIFAAAAAAVLVIKETGGPETKKTKRNTTSADKNKTKVIAYYFHGTHRCWSCNTIEAYSIEAIENNFAKQLERNKLEFVSVNVQKEENKHYIEKYNLASKMLVLVLVKSGNEVKYKKMKKVWELLRDKPAFIEYVKKGVKKYMDEV